MNRDELDAFFARADDILTNWQPGLDAMVARAPDDEDAEALPGESYYQHIHQTRQPETRGDSPIGRYMRHMLGYDTLPFAPIPFRPREITWNGHAITAVPAPSLGSLREMSEQINRLARCGLMTLSEARAELGLAPVEHQVRNDVAERVRQQAADAIADNLLHGNGFYVDRRVSIDAAQSMAQAYRSAMDNLAAEMRRAGSAIAEFARQFLTACQPPAPPAIARHAFKPDYDLACTALGCTLTPEEH